MFINGKRRTKFAVIFCVFALAAFTGSAQAGEKGCGCEHQGKQLEKHHRHNFHEIAKKLGLTDEQKAQAKAIFQGNKDVVKPIFANLRGEHEKLRALAHADTIDEAAIRAETAKIAGIRADLLINKAKLRAKFRAILTPAQLAILKSLPHEHHEGGWHHKDNQ